MLEKINKTIGKTGDGSKDEQRIVVINQEQKDQDRTEHILNIQRDIEYYSWLQGGLKESLHYVLKKLSEIDWIDCGGIYLLSKRKDKLQLVAHFGVSDGFVNTAGVLGRSTKQYNVLKKT
jgi:hypothetical protein